MPSTSDLWSVFEFLTSTQKCVVREMYWNGCTQEECAERLGVNQSSISRALDAAGRTFEKKLPGHRIKKTFPSLLPLGTGDEGAERGNGQRPNQYKAPASHGPPASFCPQPDIYYETPDREAFVKELSWIAASPFMQLQNRGGYNQRARLNRERIARDLAVEREERQRIAA